LPRALRVNDADDRENEQPLAHLQYRSGQLSDRFLLLANDAFTLLDEAHCHRVRDAVRRWLVSVQNAVQFLEVCLIFRKQRPR
jgi:hypothetical protein